MSKITSIIKSVLPRKYVYTFNSQANQYVDARFKPKMVSRMLNTTEKEQVVETLQSAFSLFTQNNQPQKPHSIPSYLTTQLRDSIYQLNSTLRQEGLILALELDQQQGDDIISKGNLEVRGIQYPVDGLFIHEIKSARIGDVVYCRLRDFVDTEQEQNKERAKKQYGDRFKTQALRGLVMSDRMENQVNKYAEYKQQVTSKSFYNKFKSNLSVYAIIIDQIPLKIKYQLLRNGKVEQQNKAEISTKWLHEVQSNTAQSVRKQPRRTLFDIEDWHRGFFVPVFDFTPIS